MEKIPSHDITPPTVGHHTPGDTTTQEMYAKRRHIYVREIKGLFQKVRRSANWALMMGFFLLPWLNWGDRPAVWFDLPGREFHIFSATFYPQEFILLSWLLIICAFGLFFITVFAGRVWCGYTCPQSVWTFLFIWLFKTLYSSLIKLSFALSLIFSFLISKIDILSKSSPTDTSTRILFIKIYSMLNC